MFDAQTVLPSIVINNLRPSATVAVSKNVAVIIDPDPINAVTIIDGVGQVIVRTLNSCHNPEVSFDDPLVTVRCSDPNTVDVVNTATGRVSTDPALANTLYWGSANGMLQSDFSTLLTTISNANGEVTAVVPGTVNTSSGGSPQASLTGPFVVFTVTENGKPKTYVMNPANGEILEQFFDFSPGIFEQDGYFVLSSGTPPRTILLDRTGHAVLDTPTQSWSPYFYQGRTVLLMPPPSGDGTRVLIVDSATGAVLATLDVAHGADIITKGDFVVIRENGQIRVVSLRDGVATFARAVGPGEDFGLVDTQWGILPSVYFTGRQLVLYNRAAGTATLHDAQTGAVLKEFSGLGDSADFKVTADLGLILNENTAPHFAAASGGEASYFFPNSGAVLRSVAACSPSRAVIGDSCIAVVDCNNVLHPFIARNVPAIPSRGALLFAALLMAMVGSVGAPSRRRQLPS